MNPQELKKGSFADQLSERIKPYLDRIAEDTYNSVEDKLTKFFEGLKPSGESVGDTRTKLDELSDDFNAYTVEDSKKNDEILQALDELKDKVTEALNVKDTGEVEVRTNKDVDSIDDFTPKEPDEDKVEKDVKVIQAEQIKATEEVKKIGNDSKKRFELDRGFKDKLMGFLKDAGLMLFLGLDTIKDKIKDWFDKQGIAEAFQVLKDVWNDALKPSIDAIHKFVVKINSGIEKLIRETEADKNQRLTQKYDKMSVKQLKKIDPKTIADEEERQIYYDTLKLKEEHGDASAAATKEIQAEADLVNSPEHVNEVNATNKTDVNKVVYSKDKNWGKSFEDSPEAVELKKRFEAGEFDNEETGETDYDAYYNERDRLEKKFNDRIVASSTTNVVVNNYGNKQGSPTH